MCSVMHVIENSGSESKHTMVLLGHVCGKAPARVFVRAPYQSQPRTARRPPQSRRLPSFSIPQGSPAREHPNRYQLQMHCGGFKCKRYTRTNIL